MKRTEFQEWVSRYLYDKSPKYRKDMVSRACRVEKAFQELDPNFSMEKEFKKDYGASLLTKLSREGIELEGTNIKLPIKSNQMFSIKAAADWYFRFLKDTEC